MLGDRASGSRTDSYGWIPRRLQLAGERNDAVGQPIRGQRFWPEGSPVAGQQFEYGFDDIGNRKVARRGGDENGWNLRESLYGVNVLNQYTNRTVPGFVDVVGVALATKPVYVMDRWPVGRPNTSAGN